MSNVMISPSILSADFGRLNDDIASIEGMVELLHVDVMDGHFVPNLSFGAPIVRCIKTSLPMQCHLMVERPEDYIEPFKAAGAAMLIVHQEVSDDLPGLIQQIHEAGMEAGVSINPDTDVSVLESVINLVDQVLVMSVHPGFGGQSFIPSAVDKIKDLRAMRADLEISVDGGINAETGKLCADAGADVLVAGSYIFNSDDRRAAIESLRS